MNACDWLHPAALLWQHACSFQILSVLYICVTAVLCAVLAQEYSHLQKLEKAYASGAPTVSDSVYDAMKVELLHKARTEHPTSTVAQRLESEVGSPVSQHSPLAKAEHTEAFGGRLRSLAAAHSATEVRAWWEKNIEPHFGANSADAVQVVLEPKVDGLTMRATFRDGDCIQVRQPQSSMTIFKWICGEHGLVLLHAVTSQILSLCISCVFASTAEHRASCGVLLCADIH